MRRLLPLAVALIAFVAVAGTRSINSSGAAPTTLSDGGTTDGVPLADSVGCRASIHVTDGGTIAAGSKLVFHYFDSTNGWVDSDSALACTVTARPDGGIRTGFACTDMEPLARFGRIAASNYGLLGSDGGSGYGFTVLSDAGRTYDVAPVTRVECWGPSIP